jgi:uncharacterized protein (DUF2236 family)
MATVLSRSSGAEAQPNRAGDDSADAQNNDAGLAAGSPDAGLYGPASEAWRLNREAMLLLGAGPRALLLQIAHPLVAAGVADHSDFRADPWRRLRGTLRSYLAIVYGSSDAARAEIRRLNALHRAITGPGYTARDPALSLWVHATLVDSTLVAADAWLERSPRHRAEAFYAETRPIGRAFGIPEAILPNDLEAFEEYVASQLAPGGPVTVGPLARDLAQTILHPPLPGVLGRLPIRTAPYDWTMWPSIALLPREVRDAYRLRWGVREQLVSAWLVAGWKAWRPVLPRTFRQMPQALAADRRMAAR